MSIENVLLLNYVYISVYTGIHNIELFIQSRVIGKYESWWFRADHVFTVGGFVPNTRSR